jgi:hypothetical protein
VHGYTAPSQRGAYNTTNFTTNDYFVFRPDIVYEINDPGISAVNCVIPAVEEVLKTGKVDKDKLGIMGHSWALTRHHSSLLKLTCLKLPLQVHHLQT